MQVPRWAFAAEIPPVISSIYKIMAPAWFINFIWKYIFAK